MAEQANKFQNIFWDDIPLAERNGARRNDPPDYMFESINELEDIEEASIALEGNTIMMIFYVLDALLLLLAIVLAIQGGPMYGALALVMCILLFLVGRRYPAWKQKRDIRKLRDRLGTDRMQFQMIFWPQGVVAYNRMTKRQQNMWYEEISEMYKYKKYLIFRVRTGRWICMRDEDYADQPGFVEYLRAKATNAKQAGFGDKKTKK